MSDTADSPREDRTAWYYMSEREHRRLKRRYGAERRFRLYGIAAILVAIGLLGFLLVSVVSIGYSAFVRAEMEMTLTLSASDVDPQGNGSRESLRSGNYSQIINDRLTEVLGVNDFAKLRKVGQLISNRAPTILRDRVVANPDLVGQEVTISLPADSTVDQFLKNEAEFRQLPEDRRNIDDDQMAWIDQLRSSGVLSQAFNWQFLVGTDSRSAEHAGILSALVGSLYAMGVCAALSVPVGVAAAVYLEEFAPKNRFTDFIEVNINNLAAVPSIVFGLLGLSIFINAWGFPRSAPLVGGMVLALMTLPYVIIAGRSALRAVPPSIRQGALAVGASPLQAVFHHVLPLAVPGILSGTIIGLAQAVGETAPLLMIGMMAFVTEIPSGVTDSSSALPVQVFLWSSNPEAGFIEKTAGGIMVLLTFMIAMNALAIYLRRRFERRW